MRLAIAALALLLLRADMYQDARNAELPAAASKLGGSSVNVQAYGAVADAVRVQCAVTSTAANPAITIASPCAFASADVGKPLVIWNAGSSATAPLATTIAAVADATHLTLASAPGQSLAASSQYVSWGTDNSAAIANAYNQAAKQLDAAGQRGYVYFPPGQAQVGGSPMLRYYGTTAAVGLAPNAYRIATQGAGPFQSVVLALAPIANTAGLAYESTGYADGNVVRDIGFDGNMLAQNVMYLACSPSGRLDNIDLKNPAAGGIGLKVGQSGSGNCPALVATAVRIESLAATDPAQSPAKHIEINSTDTTWHSPLPTGPVSQHSIHIASTASNTSMLAPHTASIAGIAAIQTDATVVFLADPQIDNGNVGTLTGIIVNGVSTRIIGGRHNLPTAASVGIVVNSGKNNTYITGFDCGRFSTLANCIKVNYPLGSNNQIFGNGPSTVFPTYVQKLNQFPAGTTSTTGVLAGTSTVITPVLSNFVPVEFQGNAANNTAGDGTQVYAVYGTGPPPANGADCATPGGGATRIGAGNPLKATSATAAASTQMSGKFVATMTPGTAHWIDLCVAAITGGTASIVNADIKATEISRY